MDIILTTFCIHIIIDKINVGLVKRHFLQNNYTEGSGSATIK